MSEIWTAKEKITENDKELIIFDVLDETTGRTRQERRYVAALPLMFVTGGYPPQIGMLMQLQELPWRFRKSGERIYLDGPSVGVEDYNPIND